MKITITSLFCLILSLGTLSAQESAISSDSLIRELLVLKKDIKDIKNHQKKLPYFNFKNGLGFSTPDSSYSVNIRFRIQNRFLMNSASDEDLQPASWEARVRRCRLSFAGHMLDPKLSYYLQLSFSRADMDWSDVDASVQNTSPNVVRDAIIFYKPVKGLQLGFGQGKLPGNRQRVVSSGSQQFYDRSIVNATYTLDRDFGFFLTHTSKLADMLLLFKGAITSGEGRNSALSNPGLAYTARLEFLPLGAFTDGGDYFEGDVVREATPKISIAGGYHFNDLAVRSGGQLGKDLLATRSFNVYMADFLFKYRGFSLSSEYIRRDTEGSPFVQGSDGKLRNIITGDGINTQASYCFPNHVEVALRHSLLSPHHDQITKIRQNEQYGIGLTKYLNRHKVKLQGNIFYNTERDLSTQQDHNRYFFAVFQIELGI